jgi:hypothetical protein
MGLEALARRILPFSEGNFSPSPPPHVLDKLTDEQLVHACNAVEGVADAASAAVSGKARLRLLAWTVADARGAQIALDKALAETVGKRLQRQADRVRATLVAEAAAAEQARAKARSAAASDAALMANLSAELERINDTVLDARQRAHEEVYIGFPELDTVLTPPPSAMPTESEVSAHEVSGMEVSTQTECQPEVVVSSLSSAWLERLGAPDDWRGMPALLQSAMDHIITLDARLAGMQSENQSLRAQVVSERCRADQAQGQLSEAQRRVNVLEEQLAEQDESNDEVATEYELQLQWDLTASRTEANQLRAEARGLRYELALLKGTV